MPEKKCYPIVHKFQQRSDEWYAIRRGRLGASDANAIFADGKGLETAIFDALKFDEKKYTNDDIERGILLEDSARIIYELQNNVLVEQVGYIEYNEHIGCSPDGLVGVDGGLEIKCPNDSNYIRALVYDKPEKKHIDQCIMSAFITHRKWWDLVYYNENFKIKTKVWRIEWIDCSQELENATKKIVEVTEKILPYL